MKSRLLLKIALPQKGHVRLPGEKRRYSLEQLGQKQSMTIADLQFLYDGSSYIWRRGKVLKTKIFTGPADKIFYPQDQFF
jgi:hypothetical protein